MVLQTKTIIIFLIGLVVVFSGLSYFGLIKTQSVITPPIQAQVSDGRVVWISTIASDSIKDGVGFSNFNPADYTMQVSADGYPAGTQVLPKDDVIVYISKNDNLCEYILEAQTFNYAVGFPLVKYYALRNPSRKIMVDVCIDATCKQLDAVNFGEIPLSFASNGGELTVKGIGALVGQKNCPEYSDVALIFDSSNVPQYCSKASLFSRSSGSWIPDFTLVTALFSQPKMNDYVIKGIQKVSFVSDFAAVPVVSATRNLLTGQMPDLALGVGAVTVTADAKYFRSAYIVPSQQAKPVIDSITITDIKQSSTGTATVKLSNTGNTGNVAVEVSAERSEVIPESQAITLAASKTLTFRIVSPINSGADKLTVKACTTDQLGSNLCVTKSKSFNILADNPTLYCGDGKCTASIGETSVTCAKDCGQAPQPVPPDTPLDCSSYNQLGGLIWSTPQMTEGKGFLGLFPYEKNTCVPNYTGLIFVIIVLLIAGLIVYFKKRK